MADDFRGLPDIEGFAGNLSDANRVLLDLNTNLLSLGANATSGADALNNIKEALSLYAELMSQLKNSELVPDAEMAKVGELRSALRSMGVSQATIAKAVGDANKLYGKQVVQMDELTRKEKKFVEEKKKEIEAQKRLVQYQGQMISLGDKSLRQETRGQRAARYSRGAVGALKGAAGLVGLPTSIMGWLSFIMNAKSEADIAGAMSRQAELQWQPRSFKEGSAGFGVASRNMTYGRFRMYKSIQEMGNLQRTMAGMGLEPEEMGAPRAGGRTLMQEMMGEEVTKNYPALQQASDLLTTMYDTSDKSVNTEQEKLKLAKNYLDTINDTARAIPGVSMEEIRKQVLGMSTSIKSYNTSMLSTMQLASVLSDRTGAQGLLGLGGAAKSTRQALAQQIAAAPESVATGMQMQIGRRIFERKLKEQGKQQEEINSEVAKKSAEDFIYYYREGMMAEGQFGTRAPMIRFQEGLRDVIERVSQTTDVTSSAGRFRMAELFSQRGGLFNFSEDVAQQLANVLQTNAGVRRSVMSGDLSTITQDLYNTINNRQDQVDKDTEMRQAEALARQLQPIEARIQAMIKEWITKKLEEIRSAIDDMKDAFIAYFPTSLGGAPDKERRLARARMTARKKGMSIGEAEAALDWQDLIPDTYNAGTPATQNIAKFKELYDQTVRGSGGDTFEIAMGRVSGVPGLAPILESGIGIGNRKGNWKQIAEYIQKLNVAIRGKDNVNAALYAKNLETLAIEQTTK